MLQTKRAIAIGNDSQWKRTHTALLVKSLIYVPLILQNKPIGVLGVTNRIKETSFDSNDTRALSALAGYATIAINNANLYQEIEVERATLGAIIDHTDESILAIDGENRIVLLNQKARILFDWPETKLAGQSIHKFLKNDAVLQFITQPANDAIQTETILIVDDRRFETKITLVPGGGRSMLMSEVE